MVHFQAGFQFGHASIFDGLDHLIGKDNVVSMAQSGFQIKRSNTGINLRQSDLHFMLMTGRWLDQSFQAF